MIEQKSYRFTEREVMQILGDYIMVTNNIEFEDIETEVIYDPDAEYGNSIEIIIYI